jgi:hypothetical protein
LWIPLQKPHYYFNTGSHSNVSNHPAVTVLIVSDYRGGAHKSFSEKPFLRTRFYRRRADFLLNR